MKLWSLRGRAFSRVILKYGVVTYYLGFILMVTGLATVPLGVMFYLNDLVVFVEWEIISFFSSRIVIVLLLD